MVDTDFPIFRLADAYLIYVEANIRGGGGSAANALTYLNAVRQRAYGNTTANFAALPPVDTILAERGRELMFEGQRRTDLIRFGVFTGGTYLWAWKGGTPGGVALPAYRALREIYPEASLTLAIPEGLQGLEFREVFHSVVWLSPRDRAFPYGGYRAGKRLKGAFDLGISFPASFSSALYLWSAGISPSRTG